MKWHSSQNLSILFTLLIANNNWIWGWRRPRSLRFSICSSLRIWRMQSAYDNDLLALLRATWIVHYISEHGTWIPIIEAGNIRRLHMLSSCPNNCLCYHQTCSVMTTKQTTFPKRIFNIHLHDHCCISGSTQLWVHHYHYATKNRLSQILSYYRVLINICFYICTLCWKIY